MTRVSGRTSEATAEKKGIRAEESTRCPAVRHRPECSESRSDPLVAAGKVSPLNQASPAQVNGGQAGLAKGFAAQRKNTAKTK